MNDHFQKIVLEATGAESLRERELIQSLWSGYGNIIRYGLTGSEMRSVVVKHVRLPDNDAHPRGWNTDLSHERKIKSYQVETAWCSAIMRRAARTEDCLVYVFGTTTRDFFTEQIALLYGRSCHIFAFDPTITADRFTTNFPDRVTFKPWGLRSGGVETRWRHPVYGRVLGELLTLQAIKARLVHSGRRLALMKVDCEGCEWAWLGRSQPGDELFLVDQLFMEFHFASTLRFGDDALRLAPTVRETLQSHFRVALSWPSYGFDGDQNKSHPQLTAAGVDPQPCCRPFLFLRAQGPGPRHAFGAFGGGHGAARRVRRVVSRGAGSQAAEHVSGSVLASGVRTLAHRAINGKGERHTHTNHDPHEPHTHALRFIQMLLCFVFAVLAFNTCCIGAAFA